jgi:hypothetical protein
MSNPFLVIKSDKVGLESDESYVIVRNRTSFLRVLGGEPEWSLLTATASEDHGRITVCADQRRLIESALRLGAELQTEPRIESDWAGREYARVCTITREATQSEEVFEREKSELFARFFEIYDSLANQNSRSADEMRELYETLSIATSGDQIYLSDGVWLSNDGSLSDRGR